MKSISTNQYPVSEDVQCPLAVIGMACRLPDAPTEDAFWSMLMKGEVNYRELSHDRLDQRLYFDPEKGVSGKTYGKIGAGHDFSALRREFADDTDFLTDDIGHRLAHHVAIEACRNAGYSPERFPHKKAGVFMGFTRGSIDACNVVFVRFLESVLDYLRELPEVAALDPARQAAILEQTIARIRRRYPLESHFNAKRYDSRLAAWQIASSLKLDGQAMIMDAACSSSLTALAIAGRSLAQGEIDAAVVGGASYFSFDSLVLFSKAQSIANSISCPFDHRAEGLICGEAHVFFVLKTLDKAVRDGDRIRAVIRGIGVSSDGKGKSLWAPRKEGQSEAVRRAYRGNVDPKGLRFIEAHATSTPLGDPTEIAAIGDVLRTRTNHDSKILVGSVKANVGHTLESAGVVGLAKAILVLEHGVVPPQIHIEKLNDQIDWKNLPLTVPIKPTSISDPEDGTPLQVAVNAFGIGGLNVHVVLERFRQATSESGRSASSVSSPLIDTPPAKQKRPVAVIGMGCVFPGAANMDAYWKLLREGADPKTEPPQTWDRFPVSNSKRSVGGFITGWQYDWKKHKVPPIQIARANPLQFYILEAVDEALERSGYQHKSFDRKRAAVVVGSKFDSDFSVSLQMGIQLPETMDALRETLRQEGVEEPTIEKIIKDYRKLFFERQPALLDETGSFTSSTLASRITKTFDLMGGAVSIDGGNVSSLVAVETGVNMIRSGESDMIVCVGAQRSMLDGRMGGAHDTLPVGEGVGVVLLKDLERAEADGDTIHAVIRDIAFAADRNIESALEKAMRRSMENTSLKKEEIDIFETVSPVATDLDMSAGNVFEQLGHLGGAAGMASLIKTVLEMEHLEIPEAAGKPRTVPTCASDGRMRTSLVGTDGTEGFGLAYNVILERGKPVPEENRKQIVRVEVASNADENPTVRAKGSPSCPIADRVPLRALIFPGQGSQYPGMLQALAEASHDCRELVDSIDAALVRLNFPTLAAMAWEKNSALGKNVFHTQLSLLVADTVYARLLRRFGVEADLCFGHSYGEYPALVAAGAWSFEDAAVATRHRCDAIEAVPNSSTGMLSTDTSPECLSELFREITSGRLYVSNRNTRQQIVVSGDVTALRELDELLKRQKRISVILPVPAGFHSPLVDAVCEPLRRTLAEIPIRFPAKPFFSSVSGRFEAEPDTLRDNLVRQMVEPVDFVAMLEKVYRQGVRQLIEVGPRNVLSNMARKIFEGRDVEILHCDLRKASGEEALAHLRDLTLKTSKRPASKYPSTPFPISEFPVTEPQLGTTSVFETPRPESDTGKKDWSGKTIEKKSSRVFPGLPSDILSIESVGTPAAIGREIGLNFRVEIRNTLSRYADLARLPRFVLPNVEFGIKRYEKYFGRDALEELKGMAEGAGVPFQALLRHNFSAYSTGRTQGPGCVYFAGRERSGAFLLGANVDVPLYRLLPGPHLGLLQLRRPESGITHLLVTGVGFLGAAFGVNAAGLSVMGAALSEFPGTIYENPGELPLALHGRLLAEAATIEDAVELIQKAERSGSWSFGISELRTGRIARIEYVGRNITLRTNLNGIVASNHRLLLEPSPDAVAGPDVLRPSPHSQARFDRLNELLDFDGNAFNTDADAAFSALRDKTDNTLGRIPRHRTLSTIWRVDNFLSVLLDAERMTLRLATTDMSRTDGEDLPVRHATLALETLLPELRSTKSVKAIPSVETVRSIRKVERSTDAPSVHSSVMDREEYRRRNTSVDGREPFSSSTRFHRHVLRMVAAPLPPASPETIRGAAIIVGDDENRVAAVLAEKLAGADIRFFQISTAQPIEEIGRTFDEIWKECPISHLFFVTAHDPSAETRSDDHYWNGRYRQGSVLPILLVKEWLSRAREHFGTLDDCAVVGATALGGDFGIRNALFSVESGAVSGLLKGVCMELSLTPHPLRVKIVDHDQSVSPERIGNDLFLETFHWDREYEIAYLDGRRYLLRAVAKPLDAQTVDSVAPRQKEKRPVWLITGGARGITAAVARELGIRKGARLHLVGSSPLPEIEENLLDLSADEMKNLRQQVFKEAATKKEIPARAWERIEKAMEIGRNFRSFRNEGIDFIYHSCDLGDEKEVDKLLKTVLRDDPEITGIVHGAGFEAACRLEKKKLENVLRTLDVKVGGAANILRKLSDRGKNPRYFIGFSSVSGRFGGVGQVDYCAANDMLAKLVAWYARKEPNCRSVCIHWPAWGEIGMAVRPESKIALQAAGLEFMPPREGIEHLLNEIHADGNGSSGYEREILIVDWAYYKRFYPDDLSVPPPSERTDEENAVPESESRSVLILGADADADALLREIAATGSSVTLSNRFGSREPFRKTVREFASNGGNTLVLTTPRDPLGASIFAPERWRTRLRNFLKPSLECCEEWLATRHERPSKLAVLTALWETGKDISLPEGGMLLQVLKRWTSAKDDAVSEMFSGISAAGMFDFAADESPEIVAKNVWKKIVEPWNSRFFSCPERAKRNENTPDPFETFLGEEMKGRAGDSLENMHWVVFCHAETAIGDMKRFTDDCDPIRKAASKYGATIHFVTNSLFIHEHAFGRGDRFRRLDRDGENETARFLATVRDENGPISGIVHLFAGRDRGTPNDAESTFGRIESMTVCIMESWYLTRRDDLSFFVGLGREDDFESDIASPLLRALAFRDRSKRIGMFSGRFETEKEFGENEERLAPVAAPSSLILLETPKRSGAAAFSTQGSFDPGKDVFLSDHRLNRRPILPMVVMLECFSEAVLGALDAGILSPGTDLIGFDRFVIKQGFVFRANHSYRYRLDGCLNSENPASISMKLTGDYRNTSGSILKTDKCYATIEGILGTLRDADGLNFAPQGEWHDAAYPDDDSTPIHHGPTLRRLERICYFEPGTNRIIAQIRVPDPMDLYSGRVDAFSGNAGNPRYGAALHAAVLDATLFACGVRHWIYHNGACIPESIGRLRFGPGELRPGEEAFAHILEVYDGDRTVHNGKDSKHACFRFTVRDCRGQTVYDVDSYRATVIKTVVQSPHAGGEAVVNSTSTPNNSFTSY